jgi:hypothetical protein
VSDRYLETIRTNLGLLTMARDRMTAAVDGDRLPTYALGRTCAEILRVNAEIIRLRAVLDDRPLRIVSDARFDPNDY